MSQKYPNDVRARLTTGTIQRLKKLAGQNDRTMSAEIRIAIREHLKRSGVTT